MPLNSLAPGFFELTYTTAHGVHHGKYGVRGVEADGTFDSGFKIPQWAGTFIDAFDGIDAFVQQLKKLYLDTVVINSFILFDQDEPETPATPVLTGALNYTGTGTEEGIWDKATQGTFSWRTPLFGQFKIVTLDVSVGSFEPILSTAGFPNLADINTYLTGTSSIIMARDNSQPLVFEKGTFTLNEKLRRAYRMT